MYHRSIAQASSLIVALLVPISHWINQANAQDSAAVTTKPTNVIVIFCDDLGYGDLGCYGHPTIVTPNLDRIANEGQKWTQFYAAESVCTPSRAALLTGRYAVRSGMGSSKRRVLFPDSTSGLPSNEITIAELLKQKGYTTHAIGKWHLGHLPDFLPTKHGFDSYFGIPYSNDMDVDANAPAGFAKFNDSKIEYFNVPLIKNEEVIERPANQTTITRRYTDEAVRIIKESTGEQPFFIYLAHNLPHVPLFASDDFRGTSKRGLYGDVVEEIDWSVGQVINALNEKGLTQSTLVVFASDNGPWKLHELQGGSAGLLRDGKGSSWEGGYRVPGIFWGPGIVKPALVDGIGSTLDLLPTIAGLTGSTLPEGVKLDGYDLSPTLRDSAPSPRREMIFYRGDEVFAVRLGPHKAHFKTMTEYVGQKAPVAHQPPLLYNLEFDPSESIDISSQSSDVVTALQSLKTEHEATIQPVENQVDKK
jgi:arylsulfatase A